MTEETDGLKVETPGNNVTSTTQVEDTTNANVDNVSAVTTQAGFMHLILNNESNQGAVDDGPDPNGFYSLIRTKYKLKGEIPPTVKQVIANLDVYIRDMQTNVNNSRETIASNQRKLWNTFVKALNASPADSNLCIDILLNAFEKNINGVFNERLLWRGIRDIKLSADDLKSFQFVGTLFLNTARAMVSAPNGKKPTKRALAATSLREVVSTLRTETAQMNLTAYYSSN